MRHRHREIKYEERNKKRKDLMAMWTEKMMERIEGEKRRSPEDPLLILSDDPLTVYSSDPFFFFSQTMSIRRRESTRKILFVSRSASDAQIVADRRDEWNKRRKTVRNLGLDNKIDHQKEGRGKTRSKDDL